MAKPYCAFWAFVVKPHFCCQSSVGRRVLKFSICYLKFVLEELVLNSLKASPLTKLFLTPGG